MAISRRTGRSRWTLALLVLTSITILTLDFRDSTLLRDARRGAATVLGPVRDAADSAFEPVSDAWNGITDYGDLKDENEQLRNRIEELEGDRYRDEDAAERLDELLDMVEIEWVGDIPIATARVVSGPASNFSYAVDIDKGSDAGVKEGMPVVTGAGLLGRVVQVSPNRSTVQLITDPEFRVGVRLVATGDLGTARGRGRDEPLLVDSNIDPDEKVREGTLVTTSGTDRSAYPASIPIGRVTRSRDSSGGLALELIIEPFVDTGDLTFVSVLLWEPR